MKSLINFLFIITISINGLSAKTPIKKVSRWVKILNLIEVEKKTINLVKNKSDRLLYRLFELETEKIKIFKRMDNNLFMSKSLKNGKAIDKRKSFQKTLSYYKKAKTFALAIIKKFPKTRYKADIYYSLALNSRDYAYDKKELYYLKKALLNSRAGSELRYLSMTSLADYYYNNKKYKRAIKFYKKVIINKTDEWYTKNLFNYGWCLLKTHKFKKAIATLEEAYKLSSTGSYIDFNEQIMTSLITFYVQGQEFKRGKDFILENTKTHFNDLFKYTKKVAHKGYFSQSLELIQLTESFIDTKKDQENLADLRIFQYDFYKQFQKTDEMFNIANQISKLALTKTQIDDSTYKFSNEVGVLQQLIKKDFSKHDRSYDVNKLNRIISYFGLLIDIDIRNTAKYHYHSAETLYSVHEFFRALKRYKSGLEYHLTEKEPKIDFDIKRKSIDAIFSCIEFAKLSKPEQFSQLEYAYLKHIKFWPKDKKSGEIFPKLYSLYFNKKLIHKMHKTLTQYILLFPLHLDTQQSLFRVQLDHLITVKNTDLLSSRVNLLYTGFLSFTVKEVKRSEKILANLLFKQYDKLAKAGNHQEAIKGYKNIYNIEKYPSSVRADAAFNMGILFTDLFETSSVLKWFNLSLALFNQQEKLDRRQIIETMSLRSSLLQELKNAADLQKLVLRNYCNKTNNAKTKALNYSSYKNAITFDLANNDASRAVKTFVQYKSCVTGDFNPLEITFINHFFENNLDGELIDFINSQNLNKKHKDLIGQRIESLFWDNYNKNQYKERNYLAFIKKLKCESCIKLTSTITAFKQFEKEINKTIQRKLRIKGTFNPDKFNKKLEKRLSNLGPLFSKGDEILTKGHPQVSVLVLEKMALLTEVISNEISSFSPKTKNISLKNQVEKQMKILGKTIEKERSKIVSRANTLINKFEVLSHHTNNTHLGKRVLDISNIRMPASQMAATIDLK